MMVKPGISFSSGLGKLVLLSFCIGCSVNPHRDSEKQKPDILLIVYDTVRADRAGCYGHPEPVTSLLDRMSRMGAMFSTAVAPAPWTLPSHASMLTGVYPHRHGARFVPPGLGLDMVGHSIGLADPAIATFPLLLKSAQYFSICVGGAPALNPILGITRDFDIVDVYGSNRSAETINHNLFEYLESVAPGKPVCVLVNYFDAHGPYVRMDLEGSPWLRDLDGPRFTNFYRKMPDGRMLVEQIGAGDFIPSTGMLHYARALYDSEIAYVDRQCENLLLFWARHRDLDHTLLILTADHGELFGENGLVDHARTLDDEVLKVPLIVRMPGRVPARIIQYPVSLVDLFATVTHFAGVQNSPDTDSESLARFWRSNPVRSSLAASEVYRDARWVELTSPAFDRDQRALYLDEFKIVWDHRKSPGIRQSPILNFESSDSREHVLSRAGEWDRAHPTVLPVSAELHPAIHEELKALGYVPGESME
ncbi:sulfatase [bacterium]|nr:sulfatase [candidate division CSSED10-310 bacterium]